MTVAERAGLEEGLRATARRVSERLRSDLGALVAFLPIESRTIANVSEHLGITAPLCQRLLRGIRELTSDPLDALPHFPGARGIGQVIEAARGRGAPDDLLLACDQALAAYERLIETVGGSQARLIEAIRIDRTLRADRLTTSDRDQLLEARRIVFEQQRRITRREMETQLAFFAYRPLDDDPDRMDCVTAMGMLGLRREPGGLPLCPMHTFAHGAAAENPTDFTPVPLREGDWKGPVGVLEEFSTDPLPQFVAKRVGGRIPLLLDPDDIRPQPVDLVLGARISGVPSCHVHPPRAQYCSLVSEGPARHLVLQVHLHRSLARRSVANVDAYMVGPRGKAGDPLHGPDGVTSVDRPQDRWFDRLPDRPTLEYLGVGLDRTEWDIWPRMRAMSASIFERCAWDPEEFVAYRAVVPYPVWGAQYLMSFEFGDEDAGSRERAAGESSRADRVAGG